MSNGNWAVAVVVHDPFLQERARNVRAMTAIFISCRRDDSRYQAHRIYEAFRRVLPGECLFMDIDSIQLHNLIQEFKTCKVSSRRPSKIGRTTEGVRDLKTGQGGRM